MELIKNAGKKELELVSKNNNWIMANEIGFSPVQSLVAAVGACGGYVYEGILTNSKIPFQLLGITMDYQVNKKGSVHPVTSIQMIFHVIVATEHQSRAVRALRLVSKNCPVIQSLDPKISVEETIHFH